MTKKNISIFEGTGLAIVVAATAMVLQMNGRNWFCSDGSFYLWISEAWGVQTSQHLSDPYSFSHLLHGVLFFGILYKLAPKLSWMWRFNISILIESLWEILENSAMVIDRYRDAGQLGYSGDSIINSMGDLMSCGLGFLLANYLGLKKSIALFIIVEIAMILTIRDSLILNVIMLVHPVEAIKTWQEVMNAG